MDVEPVPPLLALDGVSRSFGGVHAADRVNLVVARGVVHGLIGPNGAGKTTLLNVISGLLRPDLGTIRLAGRRIDRLPAYRIAQLGIRRTYQSIRLFPTMTARENVVIGMHTQRRDTWWQRLLLTPTSRRQERRIRERAVSLLERVGLAARAEDQARDLPYGEQRRLEIARALAGSPVLVLLDEPVAGMNSAEAMEIAALIRSIAAEGTSILLIEHNMEFVMDVCDHLTVLDFGRVLADGLPDQVVRDPAVITAYLGGGD